MLGFCPAFLDDSASRKAGQRISTEVLVVIPTVGTWLVRRSSICSESVKQKQQMMWIKPSSDSQVIPRSRNNVSRVQNLKEKRPDFIEIPSIKNHCSIKIKKGNVSIQACPYFSIQMKSWCYENAANEDYLKLTGFLKLCSAPSVCVSARVCVWGSERSSV